MNGPLEGCLLCLTTATETGGDATVMIVKVTSRPQGWRDASDQPRGDHTTRSDHRLKGMQNKKDKHPPSILQMFIFRVSRAIQGYAATRNDCRWLKETHEKSGKCPRGPLEIFRDKAAHCDSLQQQAVSHSGKKEDMCRLLYWIQPEDVWMAQW